MVRLWLALSFGLAPSVAVAQVFADHDPGVFHALNEAYPDSMGGGVAFADLDSDGWDDVLVSHGTRGVFAYLNGGPDADFEFSSVPDSGLPVDGMAVVGVAVSDLDNDGDMDVIVLTKTGTFLYANEGGASFRSMAGGAFTAVPMNDGSASVGDLDRDGYPEVFVTGYLLLSRWPFHVCWPDQLFANLGDLQFADIAEAAGVADEGCGLATLMFDRDADGDLDMAVANDFGPFVRPNSLFDNEGLDADGQVSFADVSVETGFAQPIYGMGLAAADVNDDGLLDIYATNIGRTLLMVSDGLGGYRDQADQFGVSAPYAHEGWRVSWGAGFLDVENDGEPDLAVAAGYLPAAAAIRSGIVQPNLLFVNLGQDGTARDEAANFGVGVTDIGHGLAVGDFDRDGRSDLLTAALNGSVHLYRNQAVGSPGVAVRLTGTVSGTDAIGAKVTMACAGLERVRFSLSSGSYASMSSRLVLLPLAGCDGAQASAIVEWPSGAVTRMALPGEGGSVNVEEPRWLAVEPEWLPVDGSARSTVTVRPMGRDGAELGPGHLVTITAEDLAVTGVTDIGDGSYSATVTAPSGPRQAARIAVSVDGALLAHRPRLRFFERDRTTVAMAPEYVTSVGQVDVFVYPRDALGRLLGDGLELDLAVTGGDVVGGLSDLGNGAYRATIAPGGHEITVQPVLGGVLLGGSARSDAVARIDTALSEVTVWPGYVHVDEVEQTIVGINVTPRDALGQVAETVGTEVELLGPRGEPVLAEEIEYRSRSIFISMQAAELLDQGPVDIFLDGIALGRPADVVTYSEPADLLQWVDPAVSRIAPYHHVYYSDGDDFAWIVGELRDSEGDSIPLPAEFAVSSVLGEPFGLRTIQGGKQFEAKVRSSMEPGTELVEIGWAGLWSGVRTSAEQVAPADRDLGGASLDLCISARDAVADGVATLVATIRPRWHDSTMLVGSGVPILAWLDGAQPLAVDYYEPGAYRVTLGPFAQSWEGRLQVLLPESAAEGRIDLRFYDPVDPPDGPILPYCVLVAPGEQEEHDGGDDGGQYDAGDGIVDGDAAPGDAGSSPLDAAADGAIEACKDSGCKDDAGPGADGGLDRELEARGGCDGCHPVREPAAPGVYLAAFVLALSWARRLRHLRIP